MNSVVSSQAITKAVLWLVILIHLLLLQLHHYGQFSSVSWEITINNPNHQYEFSMLCHLIQVAYVPRRLLLRDVDLVKVWEISKSSSSSNLRGIRLVALYTSIRATSRGWLVGFLTSSSATTLYHGRAPRQSVWQFYVLPFTRQSGKTLTSVSAGHIILAPTQPVGSGRPQRGSKLRPPHLESHAITTELPRPDVTWTSAWRGYVI